VITVQATLIEIKNGRAFMEYDGRCFTLPLRKAELDQLTGREGRSFSVELVESASPVAEVEL